MDINYDLWETRIVYGFSGFVFLFIFTFLFLTPQGRIFLGISIALLTLIFVLGYFIERSHRIYKEYIK
jgi:hypothetical protein